MIKTHIITVSLVGLCILTGCGRMINPDKALNLKKENAGPVSQTTIDQPAEQPTTAPEPDSDIPSMNEEEDNIPDEDFVPVEEEYVSAIADGDYILDDSCTGKLYLGGGELKITTPLYHADENGELVQDYEADTYDIPLSQDCMCVIYQEEAEEYPLANQFDFVNTVLQQGNSGLTITISIYEGRLVEIGFRA